MGIIDYKSRLAPEITEREKNQTVLDYKAKDVERVTKFMYSTTQGAMFIAKQVGLQFSNTKPETNQTGFFKTETRRIYNLGANTLAQVAVQGTGTHLDRMGPVPINGPETKYDYIVRNNNATGHNRLVKLYKELIVPSNSTGRVLTQSNDNFPSNNNTIIDSYLGGPDSVLGVGRTTITRTYNTTRPTTRQYSADRFSTDYVFTNEAGIRPITINYLNQLGVSNISFGIQSNERFREITGVDRDRPDLNPIALQQTIVTRLSAEKPEYRKRDKNILTVDGSDVTQYIAVTSDTHAADLNEKLLEQRINFDGNKPNVDHINLVNIYTSDERKGREQDYNDRERDLVKLKFEVIDNKNPTKTEHLVFRSYIKSFNDQSEARLNDVKYIGRGDTFYVYDGYNASYSLTFDIFAMSAAEMPVIYNKLNYLKSCLAPDYINNKMAANIFRLTVGNYLNSVPGFIRNLDITIPENAPWDIDLPVYNTEVHPEQNPGNFTPATELPRYLTVSITFTPIYNMLIKRGRTTPFISVDKLNYLK